jgi:hypothetical protein
MLKTKILKLNGQVQNKRKSSEYSCNDVTTTFQWGLSRVNYVPSMSLMLEDYDENLII